MRLPAPQTTVAIMYENSVVHVEKEELAYPISSLIADCGGIMGLFVGFNFVMIWKLLISFTTKIVTSWERGAKVSYTTNKNTNVEEGVKETNVN